MSLHLLLNREECPNCRRNGSIAHFNRCPNCGTTLFLRPINFEEYENDGNLRTYWLYKSPEVGWIHRDHIMGGLKPQERFPKIEELPENYGKEITPEQVQSRGGKTVKKIKPR